MRKSTKWPLCYRVHKLSQCKHYSFLISKTGVRLALLQCVLTLPFKSYSFKQTCCFQVQACLNITKQKGPSQNIVSKFVAKSIGKESKTVSKPWTEPFFSRPSNITVCEISVWAYTEILNNFIRGEVPLCIQGLHWDSCNNYNKSKYDILKWSLS